MVPRYDLSLREALCQYQSRHHRSATSSLKYGVDIATAICEVFDELSPRRTDKYYWNENNQAILCRRFLVLFASGKAGFYDKIGVSPLVFDMLSFKVFSRDTHPDDISHVRLPHAQAGRVRASMVNCLYVITVTGNIKGGHRPASVRRPTFPLAKYHSCYLIYQILPFVGR